MQIRSALNVLVRRKISYDLFGRKQTPESVGYRCNNFIHGCKTCKGCLFSHCFPWWSNRQTLLLSIFGGEVGISQMDSLTNALFLTQIGLLASTLVPLCDDLCYCMRGCGSRYSEPW